MSSLLFRGTYIVQLWHGVAIKKIGYDDDYSNLRDDGSLMDRLTVVINNIVFPYLLWKNDMIIAGSPEIQRLFVSAFNMNLEQVKLTGYPRNDILFRDLSRVKVRKDDRPFKCIYLPTFRGQIGHEDDLFDRFGFDPKEIDAIFDVHQINLNIKIHPANKPAKRLMHLIKESKHIQLLDFDDIYERLASYALLITDLSSIYIDYLLLDRPIIFTEFDILGYMKKDRGFYYDYESLTPGPKAHTWQECVNLIVEAKTGTDNFAHGRHRLRQRFHTYLDGNSSQRMFSALTVELELP